MYNLGLAELVAIIFVSYFICRVFLCILLYLVYACNCTVPLKEFL